MDRESKRLFEIIFQEAHVIDFDFSKWDKFVRLVVVGQLFPSDNEGRFPLFNIDFVEVSEIGWKSNHLGIQLDSPKHHCQWTIFEFSISQKSGFMKIELLGVSPSPEIFITCKKVNVSEANNHQVDIINPKWNSPYSPLARSSIEEIFHNRRN